MPRINANELKIWRLNDENLRLESPLTRAMDALNTKIVKERFNDLLKTEMHLLKNDITMKERDEC